MTERNEIENVHLKYIHRDITEMKESQKVDFAEMKGMMKEMMRENVRQNEKIMKLESEQQLTASKVNGFGRALAVMGLTIVAVVSELVLAWIFIH